MTTEDKQYDKQESKDRGTTHKYFTVIPNIIDDMDLSPIAFRLYVHLKRVTGDGGYCSHSQKKLAAICCCSGGTIVTAKLELRERGLIEIEEVHRPDQPGKPYHRITLVDIWGENMAAYQKDKGQQVTIENEGKCQPADLTQSPHDIHGQPADCIKNQLTKNINKEPSEATKLIFKSYEDEIGNLTPMISDALQEAENTYPPAWIPKAIHLAAEHNARNWKYCEAILKRWKVEGFRDKKAVGVQNADGSFYL